MASLPALKSGLILTRQKNDGSFSFTDEDWIPHSTSWQPVKLIQSLSGL